MNQQIQIPIEALKEWGRRFFPHIHEPLRVPMILDLLNAGMLQPIRTPQSALRT